MKKLIILLIAALMVENIQICFADENYPYLDKISIQEFNNYYKDEYYVGNYYFRYVRQEDFEEGKRKLLFLQQASLDGINWFDVCTTSSEFLYQIFYGNNHYVFYDCTWEAIPENKLYDGLRRNDTLYIFDDNLNLVKKWDAEGYKRCLGFIDGYFYIRLQFADDKDNIIYYKTPDGLNLTEITNNDYLDARDRINNQFRALYLGKSFGYINHIMNLTLNNGNTYKVAKEIARDTRSGSSTKAVIYDKQVDSEGNTTHLSISLDGLNFYDVPNDMDFYRTYTKKDYVFVTIQDNKDELYRIDVAQLTNNITVIYDDKILSFATPPVIENDRTLVPMRFLFEQMGAEVSWDGATRTAVVEKASDEISFSIDNTTARVNNVEKTMDVPARLVNEKTMIPLRFLSEELGYHVEWDEATKTVYISES